MIHTINHITPSDLYVLVSAYNNHGRTKSFFTSNEGVDKLRKLGLLEKKDNSRLGELTTARGSCIVELLLEVANEYIEEDL